MVDSDAKTRKGETEEKIKMQLFVDAWTTNLNHSPKEECVVAKNETGGAFWTRIAKKSSETE